MAALALTMLLLASLCGGGAAKATPLAPALLGNPYFSVLPLAPARWRLRFRFRESYDDERSAVISRYGETYGAGSVVRPLPPIFPSERPRRGRWVDPPPPE